MKTIKNAALVFAAVLLFISATAGQDLSKYRDFSLGASLATVSNQVSAKPQDIRVLQQEPALLQDLTWWPTQPYEPAAPSQAIRTVVFSFYNGGLYKIVVSYGVGSTKGLTSEDMVRALSAIYGTAATIIPEKNATNEVVYSTTEETVAAWDDSANSITLSRSPLSNSFQLVVLGKQLNARANLAVASAAQQHLENAPQEEAAREKRTADELEALRQTNLKTFRP